MWLPPLRFVGLVAAGFAAGAVAGAVAGLVGSPRAAADSGPRAAKPDRPARSAAQSLEASPS